MAYTGGMADNPNEPTDEQVDERFEELRRQVGESEDQMVRVRVIRKRLQ
jgi:hypothetical protein